MNKILKGDGSFSFTAEIEGDDIIVKNVPCTWFGGTDDPQDSGETASGFSTKDHPHAPGCSLPMDGFHHAATDGSPIPRLPWKTMVEVTNRANGQKTSVPLIDLGPNKAAASHAAIDLTKPAFTSIGGSINAGVIKVDYRIPGGAKHVPGAFLSSVSLGSSHIVNPQPAPATFASLISSLGLKYFTADEILEPTYNVNNGVANSRPPQKLWQNILPTIAVLDRIREIAGSPIYLNSTYRSKPYNDSLSGAAAQSQHLDFRAIDFRCAGVTPSKLAEIARGLQGKTFTLPIAGLTLLKDQAPLIVAGLKIKSAGGKTTFEYHGGVQAYSSFTHIDCRGQDVAWG